MKSKISLKKIFTILFVVSFIFMSLSMLVLFINIEQNKGIVPLIFVFSTFFYLFSNYEYIIPKDNTNITIRRKKVKSDIIIKILNIVGIVISILFFILSYYVFWA